MEPNWKKKKKKEINKEEIKGPNWIEAQYLVQFRVEKSAWFEALAVDWTPRRESSGGRLASGGPLPHLSLRHRLPRWPRAFVQRDSALPITCWPDFYFYFNFNYKSIRLFPFCHWIQSNQLDLIPSTLTLQIRKIFFSIWNAFVIEINWINLIELTRFNGINLT